MLGGKDDNTDSHKKVIGNEKGFKFYEKILIISNKEIAEHLGFCDENVKEKVNP